MRRYNDRLEIRLSTEQKKKLYEIAGDNCTVSELIRKRLLKEPNRENRRSNRDIHNQLKRMGNNLNQIARVLNSMALSQSPLTASDLIDFSGDVQTAISEVRILQNQLQSK